MPTEIRRLAFTHRESTQALVDYAARFDLSFPTGKIIRAKFADTSEFRNKNVKRFKTDLQEEYNVEDSSSSIIVTFFDEGSFEHKFYSISTDFVISALIEFCLAHKILLPRKAKKKLGMADFNICLDIHFANVQDSSDELFLEDE